MPMALLESLENALSNLASRMFWMITTGHDSNLLTFLVHDAITTNCKSAVVIAHEFFKLISETICDVNLGLLPAIAVQMIWKSSVHRYYSAVTTSLFTEVTV